MSSRTRGENPVLLCKMRVRVPNKKDPLMESSLFWVWWDCLDLFALNVSTDFASKNLRSYRKSPSHSAHRSLEPTKLCSRPHHKIKKALKREPSLFGCGGTRTHDQLIKRRLLRVLFNEKSMVLTLLNQIKII